MPPKPTPLSPLTPEPLSRHNEIGFALERLYDIGIAAQ